jgi:hypothetical protein
MNLEKLLQSDWWHDEVAFLIVSLFFGAIMIWTYLLEDNMQAWSFLNTVWIFYTVLVSIFAGKRYADKRAMKNE